MISVVTDATKNGLRSMTDDELFAIPNRGLKATATVITTLRVAIKASLAGEEQRSEDRIVGNGRDFRRRATNDFSPVFQGRER